MEEEEKKKKWWKRKSSSSKSSNNNIFVQSQSAVSKSSSPLTNVVAKKGDDALITSWQIFRTLLLFGVDLYYLETEDVEKLFPNQDKSFYVPNKYPIKKNNKPFIFCVEQFLELPSTLRLNWPEVFYSRMTFFQTVLSEQHIEVLKKLLHFYSFQITPEEQKPKTAELMASLLEYVDTHKYDPDNSLIGLPPSRYYQNLYEKFIETNLENANLNNIDDKNMTSESILNMIVSWAELKNTKEIGKEVVNFAQRTRIQYIYDLNPGDLVIVKLPKSIQDYDNSLYYVLNHNKNFENLNDDDYYAIIQKKFKELNELFTKEDSNEYKLIISRVVNREGDHVIIWDTPEEKSTQTVSIQFVFPFNSDMKKALGSVERMAGLVEDLSDVLNFNLRESVKVIVQKFLEDRRIDLDLLGRANLNEVTLIDLIILEIINQKLDGYMKNTLEMTYSVKSFISPIIESFQANLNQSLLFQPNKASSIKDLNPVPYCTLAVNRLKRYLGICIGALGHLEIEERLYLNGSKKLLLAEWWINLIRSSIKEVLNSKKYDFNATNVDFDSPKHINIQAIKDNLDIIKKILSNDNKEALLLKENLIAPLKEVIYPILCDYSQSMKTLIVHKIYLFNSRNESKLAMIEPFIIEDIKAELAELYNKKLITKKLHSQLLSMIKDIEYVHSMQLEEESFEFGKQVDKSSVVPISGLIVNYFQKLESELIAYLEFTESISPTPQPEQANNQSNVSNSNYNISEVQSQKTVRLSVNYESDNPEIKKLVPSKSFIRNKKGEIVTQLSAIRELSLSIPLPPPPLLPGLSLRDSRTLTEYSNSLNSSDMKKHIDVSAEIDVQSISMLSPRKIKELQDSKLSTVVPLFPNETTDSGDESSDLDSCNSSGSGNNNNNNNSSPIVPINGDNNLHANSAQKSDVPIVKEIEPELEPKIESEAVIEIDSSTSDCFHCEEESIKHFRSQILQTLTSNSFCMD